MDITEAKQALNEGKRLTHPTFTREEWVQGIGFDLYKFEDGSIYTAQQFWAIRQNEERFQAEWRPQKYVATNPGYCSANPTTRDWKGGRKPETLKKIGRGESNSLNDSINGEFGETVQLNPQFVEWMMGWPIGWTDLKPLEMDRFQEWYTKQKHI